MFNWEICIPIYTFKLSSMIIQLLPFKYKIPQLLCLSLSTSKPTQIKLFKIIRKFRIFQSCDTFCIGHILTPFFYTSCICFVCDTFCIGHPMPLCTVGSGSTWAGSPQKIKEILYFGKKKEASTQMQTINFKKPAQEVVVQALVDG